MQKYTPLTDTSKTTVKQALLNHEDNINSLRSSYSGTAFPANPTVGMHCYRTDENIEYVYNGTDWKQVATKDDVTAVVNGAPEALDTLQELSKALGDDPNFSTTMLNKIGEKADKTAVPTKISQLTNDSNFAIKKSESDANGLLNALSAESTVPGGNDYYISQYANGGTATTSFRRRPISKLWDYFKTKLASVATSGSYTDLSDKPTALKNPNVLTFTGAVTGDYDGSAAKTVNIPTVPTSLKNPNALSFTGAASGSYDGSAAKTVHIPNAPDLTPYMKKTADSDLDMGTNAITVGGARIHENADDLYIDASDLRDVCFFMGGDIYINQVPLATTEYVTKEISKATYFTTDTNGNIVLRG